MHKNLKYTIGRGRHGRRGSALMVALALLVMLAVFAALFLTSSRFDLEGAAADLDNVRMDLYAEGLAQYVQSCMVLDLWGFDDVPLNFDGRSPYATPPSAAPAGLDNPWDYFGAPAATVFDPDAIPGSGDEYTNNTNINPNGSATPDGDEYDYQSDFWLTDPRIVTNPPNPQVVLHPAFRPELQVPFGNSSTSLPLQWQYADLDHDDRADSPWLFTRPIGDGLYIRAAVRVEDTSSRVNLNVARFPIFVGGGAFEELWTIRPALYPGYPLFIDDPLGNSLFPVLTGGPASPPDMTDPNSNPRWVEQLGAFLSEMDLAALINPAVGGGANGATQVNNLGNGVGAIPGRYGTTAGSLPGSLMAQSTGQYPTAELRALLGDPTTPPTNVTSGNPGRLGNLLRSSYTGTAANFWNPAGQATWETYDPDGLARRLGNPAGVATDADRPFGTDETFDLMSLHGLELAGAAGSEYQQYRSGTGSLPTQTRLERIWLDLLVNNTTALAPLQYRRLFTTYSWSLDLCPYGEDPYYAAAGSGAHTYRKVDINTCTGREFEEAVNAANRQRLYGAALPVADVTQLTANLLDYRDRPMTLAEFEAYVAWRQTAYIPANPGAAPLTVPGPNDSAVLADGLVLPSDLEWDEVAWENHVVNAVTGVPSIPTSYLTWTPAMEAAYLAGAWAAETAGVRAEVLSRVSYDTPTEYTNSTGAAVRYGVDRQPFITEIYVNIVDFQPPPLAGAPENETAWAAPANQFAIEFYNPYLEPVSIENCEVVITRPSVPPDILVPFWRDYATEVGPSNPLTGAPPAADRVTNLPPNGRLVVYSDGTGAFTTPNANSAMRLYAPSLRIFPSSRVYVRTPTFVVNPANPVRRTRSANLAILDELQAATNDMAYPAAIVPGTGSPYSWRASRWDLRGGFWLQTGAWTTSTGGAVTTDNLGLGNDSGPPVPFIAIPSVANLGRASFLSPADLQNLLRVGPDSPAAGNLSATVNVDAANAAGNERVPLFNRSYAYLAPNGAIVDHAPAGAGAFQALMDFVTVTDFTNDGVDGTGAGGGGAGPDLSEMRMPGRLNVNTIGSDFLELDNRTIPLLHFVDPVNNTEDAAFWHTFMQFRELAAGSPFNAAAGGRLFAATGVLVPSFPHHPGIGQTGELCNLQYTGDPDFQGFWQDRASLAAGAWPAVLDTDSDGIPDYLLPAEHVRRFARNMNTLTTRSDTYMVTVRVEIVRPVYTGGVLTRIDTLGQREYMYLVDRSYCARPPQQPPTGGWDPLANFYDGHWNPDFIPPRAWRMTIPSYIAY